MNKYLRFIFSRRHFKSYCQKLKNSYRKRKLGVKSNVSLGKSIRISGHGILRLANKVRIEDECSFCFNPISDKKPEIIIGEGTLIGKRNDFGCSESIVIEEHVITAPYVHYSDRNHSYEDVETPIMKQPTSVKGSIHIGRGSWIGFGAQIMSGVTIGIQCVVAAGAIVTKDIPDYCIAGGNPAKILKRYNFQTKKWEKP
jgi:putative acetyltransferase